MLMQVLPVMVFLSSVVSVLFYWGALQCVIRKLSWVFQVTMGTTAAESLAATANIFLGNVCNVVNIQGPICLCVYISLHVQSYNLSPEYTTR